MSIGFWYRVRNSSIYSRRPCSRGRRLKPITLLMAMLLVLLTGTTMTLLLNLHKFSGSDEGLRKIVAHVEVLSKNQSGPGLLSDHVYGSRAAQGNPSTPMKRPALEYSVISALSHFFSLNNLDAPNLVDWGSEGRGPCANFDSKNSSIPFPIGFLFLSETHLAMNAEDNTLKFSLWH